MALAVAEFKQTGAHELTVVVASAAKGETTEGPAKQLAIDFGRQKLGRCGVSHFGNWGYRNPPDAEHPKGYDLTEQDMITPGALKAGGVYLQEIVVKAGL